MLSHIESERGGTGTVPCHGIDCRLLPTLAGGWCKDFGVSAELGLHQKRRKWASLLGWREQLRPVVKVGQQLRHVYEFGVFGGASMREMRQWLGNKTRMFGFDSFAGLPPDPDEAYQQKNFQAGMHHWQGNVRQLQHTLGPRTRLIQGFYNESLTNRLVTQWHMQPAAYVDIDADLFVSTRQALGWMFRSGLATNGTLIGYDDWWASTCSRGGGDIRPLETGEGRAHAEIAAEHNVEFRCVSGSCDPDLCTGMVWGPIFRVESVGRRANHGFLFSQQHERQWARSSELCGKKRARSDHGIL